MAGDCWYNVSKKLNTTHNSVFGNACSVNKGDYFCLEGRGKCCEK